MEHYQILREARKRLGLSQLDIATTVGVHVNTIVRIEKGHTADFATIQAFAETVGLEIRFDQRKLSNLPR